MAASILRGSYRKIMMLYDVEVRFGNAAQDEVQVSLVLGRYALRFSGGWKSLLRDTGTETYLETNNSPTTRLRCDLLLRLALVNLGPLAVRRVPQSACCAAWKNPIPCFMREDAGNNPLAVVGIQAPAGCPCLSCRNNCSRPFGFPFKKREQQKQQNKGFPKTRRANPK